MPEHRSTHTVAADHPCLAGHFPGNPVVPAVLLLEAVAVSLAGVEGRPVRLAAIPSAKFLAPVAPGAPFTVVLQRADGGLSARFRIEAGGREVAGGRVEYAHDA